MNEKILSILIPICGVYSTFGMAGELYFPNSMDVISSAEDAQYWFADNYSLLSGSKKVPNIKFDKVTEGANSIQYRFYQDFPKAQECRSSIVINLDKKNNTVDQLYVHLKQPQACSEARTDKRSFELNKPLVNTEQSQQKKVAVDIKVFDPDPVTALQDNSITYDNEIPQEAYKISKGIEVTEVNGVRYLANDRVVMVDVVGYKTQPDEEIQSDYVMSRQGITTTVNNFMANRDPIGYRNHHSPFLDAMVFYHIDHSLRYFYSLGFKPFSQPVQADALYGNKDNSVTYGKQNIIVFGNGMSADAEDGEVILHELAHMINYRLVSNWDEGDTGAIGEGLGDYWAASYSYSQNPYYQPNMVFHWDGINTHQNISRSVNDKNAKYVAGLDYTAHVIRNSSNADQLWSSPLFSVLKQAINDKGKSAHREVDTIIWDGIAPLGAGVTMPQAAMSIIQAAKRHDATDSYYADLFINYFKDHEIINDLIKIDVPQFLSLSDENNSIPLKLINTLGQPIKNVTINIKNINDKQIVLTNFNGSKHLIVDNKLGYIPNCGETLYLDTEMILNIADGQINKKQKTTVPIIMCEPLLSEDEQIVNTKLLDAKQASLLGTVAFGEKTYALNINNDDVLNDKLVIKLDIKHPKLSDLQVSIITPSGDKEIPLLQYNNIHTSHLTWLFMISNKPELESLVGMPMKGRWQLKVRDRVPGNQGQLISWGVGNISGYKSAKIITDKVTNPETQKNYGGKSGGSLGYISLMLMAFMAVMRKFFYGKKG
ncbi:proprotein convertase P-domain-containing protein [Photobacterium damselae]|uniref:proprotein convertase P-domain-containing protein n=1 Tax=Photobacterium damselae TaxID=38293 RepID=UPI00370C0A9E